MNVGRNGESNRPYIPPIVKLVMEIFSPLSFTSSSLGSCQCLQQVVLPAHVALSQHIEGIESDGKKLPCLHVKGGRAGVSRSSRSGSA